MPKAVLSSGVTLHYQQVGVGPDLVLVHGLTGNLAIWHLQMVPLLMQRFRVLTYDLRGHGYSEVPPEGYTPDDMAADLLALLDALGIEKAAVVGHSYGADTALYFAHHHPERVRAVVAIEAALPAMIHRRAREDWPGWRQWTDVLERSGFPVPDERRADADYLLRQSLLVPKKWGPLKGLPRNPKPFLRLIEETTIIRDHEVVGGLPLAEIEHIDVPVTLLYSEGSTLDDTFDYLSAHLPDVRPVRMARTEWGHFGPLEQPEAVTEEVLRALDPDPAPSSELPDPTPEPVGAAAQERAEERPKGRATARALGTLAGVQGALLTSGTRRRRRKPEPGGDGRSVIVTGASTGLGLETALHLAAVGFTVYATVRDPAMTADVQRAAADRGLDLRVLRLDLTDAGSIAAAVATVVAETGEVFGLVNNGGLGLRGCLEDLSDSEVRGLFEANVFGTIAVTKAVLPHMRGAGRGRIVTISSVGGRISSFGVSAYCATKFAQEGIGEGLALEVAPFGIQAVLVEPGMIKTTRWTTNRATAAGALEPTSAYRDLFTTAEALADRVVERSRTSAADVAGAVATALTVDKPRMRYVVGQPAGAVILLRRYLPERTFERLYFGSFLKQLQRRAGSRAGAAGPPDVAEPAEGPSVPAGREPS
jgi:NAD(P)-dependent dehydrogenase (short-subunit alcohol dehydrogenase family)/pimeloyl-ACP methyl ester carboxylesterase